LTVDGKSRAAPLTVKMDPRVPASTEILNEQFSLSISCYKNSEQTRKTRHEIHSIQNQIHDRMGKVSDKNVLASLAQADTTLLKLSGDGGMEDLDVMYGSSDASKPETETLTGVRTKFLYLMLLVQNADAKPTAEQEESFGKEKEILSALMNRWAAFGQSEIPKLNAALQSVHADPLEENRQ